MSRKRRAETPVQEEFRKSLYHGGRECDRCGRWAQYHPVHLATILPALRDLVEFCDQNGTRWARSVDVWRTSGRMTTRGLIIGKAKHWSFVVGGPHRGVPDGNWSPTEDARLFLSGRLEVPPWCVVYLDLPQHWSKDQVVADEIEGRVPWEATDPLPKKWRVKRSEPKHRCV